MKGDTKFRELQLLGTIDVIEHHRVAGIAAGLFKGAPGERIFEQLPVQRMSLADVAKLLEFATLDGVIIGCGQERDQILNGPWPPPTSFEAGSEMIEI